MGLIYECCKNCPNRGNVCVCDAPTFSRLVEDNLPSQRPYQTLDEMYGNLFIEQIKETRKVEEENTQLKKELNIYKKALELACEKVDYVVTKEGIISAGLFGENVEEIKNYFIEKAKEQLKDDKN